MDLVLELQDKLEDLQKSLTELRKSGTALAQAEKEYKILLRQEKLSILSIFIRLILVLLNYQLPQFQKVVMAITSWIIKVRRGIMQALLIAWLMIVEIRQKDILPNTRLSLLLQ